LDSSHHVDNFSRETVRHILASGLPVDVACRCLVGWATKPNCELAMGRLNVLWETAKIDEGEVSSRSSTAQRKGENRNGKSRT